MEAIFFYASKVNSIKEMKINLSPKFTCTYENKQLIIVSNNYNELKNYYGKINSVSLISGQNGCGKTTLFDIWSKYNRIYPHDYSYSYFVVYHIENDMFHIEGRNDFPDNIADRDFSIRSNQYTYYFTYSDNFLRFTKESNNYDMLKSTFYFPVFPLTQGAQYFNSHKLIGNSLLTGYYKFFNSVIFKNSKHFINKIPKIRVRLYRYYKEPLPYCIKIFSELGNGVKFFDIDDYDCSNNATKDILFTKYTEVFESKTENKIHRLMLEPELYKKYFDYIYRFLKDYNIEEHNCIIIKEDIILKNFFEAWDNNFLRNSKRYIQVSVVDYSTGELFFIELMSKVYSSIEFMKQYKSVFLLFDEIEMNLHPELTRQLVKYLVDCFNILNLDCEINIYMSSHQPILVSDVFRDRIIKLVNKDNNITSVKSTNGILSNISSVLIDDCFLTSTFGEYSIEKFCYYRDNHLKKESINTQEEIQNLKLYIEQISDEIIKHKLVVEFNENFNLSTEELYLENFRLKRELELYQKGKKND